MSVDQLGTGEAEGTRSTIYIRGLMIIEQNYSNL